MAPRRLIRWVLGRTFYPDNTFTRNRDGSPMSPYDLSTDNFAEFMGVRMEPVESPVEARLTPVTEWLHPELAWLGSDVILVVVGGICQHHRPYRRIR